MSCQITAFHWGPSVELMRLHTSECRKEAKASLISPHRRWFSPVLATCSILSCLSCLSDLLRGPARRLYSSIIICMAFLCWSMMARVAWDIHGFLARRRGPKTSLVAETRVFLYCSTWLPDPPTIWRWVAETVVAYSRFCAMLERDGRFRMKCWIWDGKDLLSFSYMSPTPGSGRNQCQSYGDLCTDELTCHRTKERDRSPFMCSHHWKPR